MCASCSPQLSVLSARARGSVPAPLLPRFFHHTLGLCPLHSAAPSVCVVTEPLPAPPFPSPLPPPHFLSLALQPKQRMGKESRQCAHSLLPYNKKRVQISVYREKEPVDSSLWCSACGASTRPLPPSDAPPSFCPVSGTIRRMLHRTAVDVPGFSQTRQMSTSCFAPLPHSPSLLYSSHFLFTCAAADLAQRLAVIDDEKPPRRSLQCDVRVSVLSTNSIAPPRLYPLVCAFFPVAVAV